jgi:signal transduction histidine kinase
VVLVPYVALAVSTALALLLDHRPDVVARILLTAAVTALWILWFVTLHPAWEERRGLMAGYYVGLMVLVAILVAINPVFGFFAWCGYIYAVYALRGRWRIAGVAATALLTATSQVGGLGIFASVAGVAIFAVVAMFNLGVAGVMIVLATITQQQAELRQRMIEELAEANAKLATAMAENAGLHAQLLAQAREAGALDERQRMAGEIHDTLAQGLTGIVTQLEAAEQAGSASAEWRRHVRTAAQLARDSLTEARRSVHALRPQPLDGARLPDALSGVVEQWSSLHGLTAELVTTGDARPLRPEIEVALLRTAQEALANVAKHAGASRVGLTLSYMEDVVTLDVRDDGTGFDATATPAATGEGGGFGLTAMRERVSRIAGTLAIESEPGGGTAISACVPALPR